MASLFFWLAVAVIAYTYAGYPLWIFLLSRLEPHRWKQEEIYPTVSIIVAVHNGEKLLAEQIDHLMKLDYPADLVQVLVVSDGSTDRTNRILRGIKNPRLSPIFCQALQGKAQALNQAISRATGDILLFVDVRPRLARTALRQLVSNFADPTVGCVTGKLCLQVVNHSGSTRAVSNLYWRYEQAMRECEALVDSALGVYGGFYAVRRELATTIPQGTILDDMYQPLSIVRRGFRSVIDDQALAWDRWPEAPRAEFARKVRTLAGNYQLIQKAPWLLGPTNRLRFQLISHKLLRLVVPFLMLVMLLASFYLLPSQLYTTLFVAQIAFYGFAAVGFVSNIKMLRRITGPASAFVLLNAAAAVALFMFLWRRNSLLSLWVKPEFQTGKRTVRAA